MTRARRLVAGASVGVAIVVMTAACGGSSAPARSVPSGGSSPTAASPVSGSRSGASNLSATPDVKAELAAAIAAMHQLTPSDYAGLVPGSTYYAVDHATGDYWAGAAPNPRTYEARVSSQDDGSYVVLTRTSGGSWHGYATGLSHAQGVRCPLTVPADVLTVWNWSPGSCAAPNE